MQRSCTGDIEQFRIAFLLRTYVSVIIRRIRAFFIFCINAKTPQKHLKNTTKYKNADLPASGKTAFLLIIYFAFDSAHRLDHFTQNRCRMAELFPLDVVQFDLDDFLDPVAVHNRRYPDIQIRLPILVLQ